MMLKRRVLSAVIYIAFGAALAIFVMERERIFGTAPKIEVANLGSAQNLSKQPSKVEGPKISEVLKYLLNNGEVDFGGCEEGPQNPNQFLIESLTLESSIFKTDLECDIQSESDGYSCEFSFMNDQEDIEGQGVNGAQIAFHRSLSLIINAKKKDKIWTFAEIRCFTAG